MYLRALCTWMRQREIIKKWCYRWSQRRPYYLKTICSPLRNLNDGGQQLAWYRKIRKWRDRLVHEWQRTLPRWRISWEMERVLESYGDCYWSRLSPMKMQVGGYWNQRSRIWLPHLHSRRNSKDMEPQVPDHCVLYPSFIVQTSTVRELGNVPA